MFTFELTMYEHITHRRGHLQRLLVGCWGSPPTWTCSTSTEKCGWSTVNFTTGSWNIVRCLFKPQRISPSTKRRLLKVRPSHVIRITTRLPNQVKLCVYCSPTPRGRLLVLTTATNHRRPRPRAQRPRVQRPRPQPHRQASNVYNSYFYSDLLSDITNIYV